MCLICIDFDRGALQVEEARRALGEMRGSLDPAHAEEVEKKLAEAQDEQDSAATTSPTGTGGSAPATQGPLGGPANRRAP